MKSKSFTLIELLVVIVIIGILAGVIIVSTSSSINKANLAKAQSFSNTVQNELLLNLVSEWTFDNPNNAGEDTWGNNDGTVSGAAYQNKSTGNCVYGGCYLFDGNAYIEVSNSSLVTSDLAISGAITVSSWVKFNSSSVTGIIIGRGNPYNSGAGYIFWRYSDNRILFDIYNSGVRNNIGATYTITDNNWHYIVSTWDGTTTSTALKLYLDGSLNNKTSATISSIEKIALNFRIGVSSSGGAYLNGLVDDSRVYNTALTTAQVKQEYIAGINSLLANGNISKEEYDQRLNNLAYGN